MSRICATCDKHPSVGNLVSHANNKVKRWVYPNVHKMRFKIVKKIQDKAYQVGKVYRGSICTKCVKKGKIEKVI